MAFSPGGLFWATRSSEFRDRIHDPVSEHRNLVLAHPWRRLNGIPEAHNNGMTSGPPALTGKNFERAVNGHRNHGDPGPSDQQGDSTLPWVQKAVIRDLAFRKDCNVSAVPDGT